MKRKRKHRRSKGLPIVWEQENSFGNLSEKERVEKSKRSGEQARRKFEANITTIEEVVEAHDPLHILGILSNYGLMVGLTHDDRLTEIQTDEKIFQSHVELVHAIALTNQCSKTGLQLADRPTIQKLWDALKEIFQNYSLSKLGELVGAQTKQEKSVIAIKERIRSHTQAVRNVGYHHRVIRQCEELYKPMETYFRESLGHTAAESMEVFSCIVALLESRVNDRVEKLRSFLREKTAERIVEAFFQNFPKSTITLDTEVKNSALDSNVCIGSLKALLMSIADENLRELYTFSAFEISNKTNQPESVIQSVFTTFSIAPNSISTPSNEYFLLDNPVWWKPLIDLGSGEVFCSIPQCFFSNPTRTIQNGINGNTLKKRIEKRRSDYLEEEVARMFTSAFEDSSMYTNVSFRIENETYETDLLVLVDSCLLIVEAKSGAVSPPALRGATDTLKREIRKLIVDPSVQSRRLEQAIKNSLSAGQDPDFFLTPVAFDWSSVKRTVCLSVTLEDLGALQSSIAELSETGWLPNDLDVAPTIVLPDLEIVFEVLETEAERIHYLIRRTELQSTIRILGTELDILGLYLDTCLNLPPRDEIKGKAIVISGFSDRFDEYFQLEERGIRGRAPRVLMNKKWRQLILYLKERSFRGWTEAAYILLSVAVSDQDEILGLLNQVKRSVRRKSMNPDHKNTVFLVPRYPSTDAVGFAFFTEDNYQNRYASIQAACSSVFENDHIRRCLVVSKIVSATNRPYEMITILESDDPT